MAEFSCTILVVDDSEDFRNLLSNHLAELNCRLVLAHDGEEAVELYGEQSFDLIIMDIIMPLMDGVDAIRAIRRAEMQQGKEPIPILALSADKDVEISVDSMDAGATRMLAKSVSRQGLLDTVKELIGDLD